MVATMAEQNSEIGSNEGRSGFCESLESPSWVVKPGDSDNSVNAVMSWSPVECELDVPREGFRDGVRTQQAGKSRVMVSKLLRLNFCNSKMLHP